MTKTKIILISLSVFFVSFFVYFGSQSYEYPSPDEIDKRLNYLERVIYAPLDKDSEIARLRKESYEFMLFSYAYTAYAATNIAVNDSSYTPRSSLLIRECILKTLDKKIFAPYGIDSAGLHSDTLPHYSVLYLGHLNLMLGCYRTLSPDTTFDRLNDRISESLFARYNNTEYLCLESYPSAIWIPDNTVALASLKLYSHNTGADFDSVCSKWTDYAKANYIDHETGVLCSTVSPKTGQALEEPRGSMLGWSIMFIYQFDSAFASELYQNYKKHFSDNLLLFRLFRERHNDRRISMGDIDSGPVFLGYSIPANEFALSGAVLSGDTETAGKIVRLINVGAKTIDKNDEIKYSIRFVNMNVSPMSEALVLNSLTVTRRIPDE